jgi:hypothetical protein
MAPIVRRIEPYPRSMRYADHKPLLGFLRRIAKLLVLGFSPPDATFLREEQPETGTEIGKTVVRLGDSRNGFEIVYTVTTHPHWGYRAVDDLVVSAYGLPSDRRLSIKALQSFGEMAGPVSYVELCVEGPEEAVTAIVEAFKTEFSPAE